MPAAARESGSVSRLNWGVVRERGIERTSTSSVTPTCCKSATNSARVRVEWPIVKIATPRGAGASAMARPGSVWARNQVGIEIPWVRRHFLANPRWELQALVRGRKFNFRDDQPGVGAIKFVDLPHPPAERNTIATLVDQGLKAEVVKHLFGIGRRYRVLEFGM